MKISERKREDLIDYFRTYKFSYEQIAKKLNLNVEFVKEVIWNYLKTQRNNNTITKKHYYNNLN